MRRPECPMGGDGTLRPLSEGGSVGSGKDEVTHAVIPNVLYWIGKLTIGNEGKGIPL